MRKLIVLGYRTRRSSEEPAFVEYRARRSLADEVVARRLGKDGIARVEIHEIDQPVKRHFAPEPKPEDKPEPAPEPEDKPEPEPEPAPEPRKKAARKSAKKKKK